MISRRIDTAFESLAICRGRVPFLRDLYRPGSPERAALEEVLEVLRRADDILLARNAKPPAA